MQLDTSNLKHSVALQYIRTRGLVLAFAGLLVGAAPGYPDTLNKKKAPDQLIMLGGLKYLDISNGGRQVNINAGLDSIFVSFADGSDEFRLIGCQLGYDVGYVTCVDTNADGIWDCRRFHPHDLKKQTGAPNKDGLQASFAKNTEKTLDMRNLYLQNY